MNLRNRIIGNVKAYNNQLTDGYLESKSTRHLIGLTHPVDRDDFLRELNKKVSREKAI